MPVPVVIKALIFDLDGTAIPNHPDGRPSRRVMTAVAAAQKKIKVAVATGRTRDAAEPILETLNIQHYCILNGGTQLYDRQRQRYVWEQKISQASLHQLLHDLHPAQKYQWADEQNPQPVGWSQYCHQLSGNVALPVIFAVDPTDKDQILTICQKHPDVMAHAVPSWTKDHFDIHISHREATKKHAMEKLLTIWQIPPEQVMVVGDGDNDRPLFAHAGWKVAMGNAAPSLQKIADWIAPRVQEDGLAAAIEKFV